MKLMSRQAGLAFIAAIVAVAALVAPVTADTSKGESGMTGVHSLRDSEATPGINCRYTRVRPSPSGFIYEAKLTSIDVRPPRMKAHAGTQKVGWLFVVQRAPYYDGATWSTTYTSPLQTRMTNASTNAAFTQMSTGVSVPPGGEDSDDGPPYFYRVRVVMFWYNAAGFINGSSTHQVDWVKAFLPDFPPRPLHTRIMVRDWAACKGWTAPEI